jgi:hypothetical protein
MVPVDQLQKYEIWKHDALLIHLDRAAEISEPEKRHLR